MKREVRKVRLILSKPKDGLVTVRLVDRRGITGRNWQRKDVPVAEAVATAADVYGLWKERKDAIQDARKGKIA